MMKYTCPVCGFDQLPHPPSDYMICPSCDTEFGYTDFNVSHDELRKQWRLGGARWQSKVFPPPSGWNPYLQLARAGLNIDIIAPPSSQSQPPRTSFLFTSEDICPKKTGSSWTYSILGPIAG